MSVHLELHIFAGDSFVATVFGLRDEAIREAKHYAMMYADDGEIRVEEIIRKPFVL